MAAPARSPSTASRRGPCCPPLDEGPGLVRAGVLARGDVSVPCFLPLYGPSPLAMLVAQGAASSANRLVDIIGIRAMAAATPRRLRLVLADGEARPESFSPILLAPKEIRGERVARDPEQIKAALRSVVTQIEEVVESVLPRGYASLDDYNADPKTKLKRPRTLLLVVGYPHGFDVEATSLLSRILRTGPVAGVHAVLSGQDAAIRAVAPTLTDDGTILIDRTGAARLASISASLTLDEGDGEQLRHIVTRALERTTAGTTSLALPVPAELWQEAPGASISAPIGVDTQNEPVLFELGVEGTKAHALVCGMTGSGKSWLLHAIILGLALRYSPDHVKLLLLDFKDLAEFAPYERLPHARLVARSDREYATNVLRGLERELRRRSALTSTHGGNVVEYTRRTSKVLPRLVVVIDEFQSLFEEGSYDDDARRILMEILSKGRSAGIHVVLATQTLRSVRLGDALVSQIGTRIGMRLASEDDAAALFGQTRARSLELEPGHALLNASAGLQGRDRELAVFAAKTEVDAVIEALVRRDGRTKTGSKIYDALSFAPLEAETCLRVLARQRDPDDPIAVAIGEKMEFDMEEDDTAIARFELLPVAGRCLLICGPSEQVALSVATSIAASYLLEGGAVVGRLFLLAGEKRTPRFDQQLGRAAAFLKALAPERITLALDGRTSAAVEAIDAELDARRERRDRGAPAGDPWLVVIVGPRRLTRRAAPPPSEGSSPDLGGGLLAAQRAFLESVAAAAPAPADGEHPLRRWLREGPDVGIHCVVWTDRLATALGRWLERSDLGMIDGRVGVGTGDWEQELVDRRPPPLGPTSGLLVDTTQSGTGTKFRAFDWNSALAAVDPPSTR